MKDQEYSNIYKLEDRYWWYQGTHALVICSIKRWLSLKDPLICDAGCGTGGLLECLRQEGFSNAYGFDASPCAIELLKKRAGINKRIYLGDVEQSALPGMSFDAVISIDVLYHLNVRKEITALKEFFRALKPGGILILQLPAFTSIRGSHDTVTMARKRYRLVEVKAYLEQAGFKIVCCSYRNLWLFLPMWLCRLFSRIRQKDGAAGFSSDLKELPWIINAFLYALVKLENCLLNKASLPFGTSVFCVARKE